MRIDDIKFERRNGPKGTITGLQLGRHWVFQNIVVTTYKRALASIPMLDWNVRQTAKALYGDPAWESWEKGHRHAIGRCIRFFAEHDVLPLRVINPKATGTKYYSLRASKSAASGR
jgi:hypothetical protein